MEIKFNENYHSRIHLVPFYSFLQRQLVVIPVQIME